MMPIHGKSLRFTCPVSARCGGCQLNRLTYAQQLHMKQEQVATLLAPFCEVQPILGMKNPIQARSMCVLCT